MSQIDDLRAEADLWRSVVSGQPLACMLDKAADTIESLARMCKQAEYCIEDRNGNKHCPWCDCTELWGHAPSCEWVTNGVALLLGEETE